MGGFDNVGEVRCSNDQDEEARRKAPREDKACHVKDGQGFIDIRNGEANVICTIPSHDEEDVTKL